MFVKDFEKSFGDLDVVPVEPSLTVGGGSATGGLPSDLHLWDPGLGLAAFLVTVDRGRLSGHDRVTLVRARSRLISHLTAGLYADIASVAEAMTDEFGDDPEMAQESATLELRAALRLTRRSADIEIGFAQDLVGRLPRVAVEMLAGRVDLRRARVLVDETMHLTESQARLVVDEVMDRAPEPIRVRVSRLATFL
ncbi:MAG TPA: DUF222 domain-containing protein [Acidimicrobiia bacterium]